MESSGCDGEAGKIELPAAQHLPLRQTVAVAQIVVGQVSNRF
jgi:hypothetical protein